MSRFSKRRIYFAAAAALLSVAALSSPAAAIRCEGQFQISGGNRIATPYCEDAYLAQVARSYGSRVSAETIRHSPTAKVEICSFIGADIRVSDICSGYRPEDRRP